jgi:hypothetical protein
MGCYESKIKPIKGYICSICNCEAERLYTMRLKENLKVAILLCKNNHKTRVIL